MIYEFFGGYNYAGSDLIKFGSDAEALAEWEDRERSSNTYYPLWGQGGSLRNTGTEVSLIGE